MQIQFIGVILMTNSSHKRQLGDIIMMALLIIAISLPFHHTYPLLQYFNYISYSGRRVGFPVCVVATGIGAFDVMILSTLSMWPFYHGLWWSITANNEIVRICFFSHLYIHINGIAIIWYFIFWKGHFHEFYLLITHSVSEGLD